MLTLDFHRSLVPFPHEILVSNGETWSKGICGYMRAQLAGKLY